MLQVNQRYKSTDFQDCYSKTMGLALIVPGQVVKVTKIVENMVVFEASPFLGELSLQAEKFKAIFRRLS